MQVFRDLLNGKGYIDGITIISATGEILFTAKFNNKLNGEIEDNYEVVGKKFFEIYENLDADSSSLYKSMELGVPIYCENQKLKSTGKRAIYVSSLSIPIKSSSKIVGSIDLSVSEQVNYSDSDSVAVDSKMFDENKVETLNKEENKATYIVDNIITNNPKMQEIKNYVKIVAMCDLPVMIYGETGTGKELFAQSIHNSGERKSEAFISQNCAAIPEHLLESLLFGTAKGAFTGALDNVGLLELANGGTLFLDEINSMPLHLQSKLLRVLQDGRFRSIGSKQDKIVDIKIISATNKEPLKAIEDGELRRDLFYRLSVMNINIPPLRERKDDIPLLVNYNIAKFNQIFGKNIKFVSNKVNEKLMSYSWPGNLRELENLIVYALSVVDNKKEKLMFSDIEYKFEELTALGSERIIKTCSLKDSVAEFEKNMIKEALNVTEGNVAQAAKLLQTPRQTLQRKVKEYEL